MTILAFIILAFLVYMNLVSVINAIAPIHLSGAMPKKTPRCSVLIPARNEEENIALLLSDLQEQSYPVMDVWVYDDQSTDATAEIVRRFEQQEPHFHYIGGKELPDEWIGKNYACHQLAKNAHDGYLLFLDADVRVESDLVTKAVDYMQQEGVHMFSIFPRQTMKSIGEWVTVPLMNWILVSLLPLPLVRRTAFPSLAAANGQCMMFDARSYHEYQWHAYHKGQVAEDIAIARSMKFQGYRVDTLLGDQSIECRMYSGYKEAVRGFAKNIHAYFGNSYLLMLLFTAIIVAGFIPVGFRYGVFGVMGLMIMMFMNRWITSHLSHQKNRWNLLFFPLQLITLIHVVTRSLYNRMKGTFDWKGRTLST